MAHADLGVDLAANTVQSSGKKALRLRLALSPGSATGLDDKRSSTGSLTPGGCGMEPGLV